MKTFDRPGINSDETQLSVSSDTVGIPDDFAALLRAKLPLARRTAVLSVIPGLGQLRNGERAKGILFLVITLANVALAVGLAAGNSLKPILTSVAVALHRQPNWELGAPLQSGLIHSPAPAIYALLAFAFIAYAMRDAYDGALYSVRTGGQPLPKTRLTLSEATSGSYLFHLTVMVSCVLAVILFITPQPKATQVTQFILDAPQPRKSKPARKHEAKKPALPAANPKPTAIVTPKPVVVPKPVVQKPVVQKPVVQKPVVVHPPIPTPVAVAVPTKEPIPLQPAPVAEPAPPAPLAAAPAASGSTAGAGSATGSTTGTGQGSNGDSEEVDMGPYMRDLQKRIKAHWFPPKGNENKRIKVSFKIYKDGHIGSVKLVVSSGVGSADDAATTAVQEAAPFGTLPAGVGDDVDINFTFDYHVFGGR
jgi:TonB family protein